MAERLIDAEYALELAKEKIYSFTQGLGTLVTVKWLLSDCPTIEAKPVVHAHWDEVSGGRTICTNCGNYPLYDYFGRLKLSDICPHCGAQMDEVIE